MNDRLTGWVLINRSRWQALTDVRTKKATMLHEGLSLVGLEETASYPISSRYLEQAGLDCGVGLCNQPPVELQPDWDFSSAEAAFAGGEAPSLEGMVGSWRRVGEVSNPAVPLPGRCRCHHSQ